MSNATQTGRSVTSSTSIPVSPRATLPGYIRRSSAAISSPNSSASNRNSTIPTTPSAGSVQANNASFGSVIVTGVGGPDILDRPRDRSKNLEVSSSALAFLFAEMVSYTQNRVAGISDLEKKLSLLGYRVGQRVLPLLYHRLEFPVAPSLSSSSSTYNRAPKREIRLLPVLLWLHTQLWKALFGRPADSLERSTEKSDEYMISTNHPVFAKSMTVPKEMNQLSVEAFTAGIIEAALDGLGFPARVTAHSVPSTEYPLRTTILVKLNKEVMEREEALGPA
ncbi:hypothetical protein CBS101457_001635 [Exobasidium rhododendri]|nr:hypothetical protein CBS101457_001635 [Exobasidium rhododendri]